MSYYFNVKKDEAIAVAVNRPISLKYSVELARELKNKPVVKVMAYLDDIITLRRHVPLRKYNRDTAHRKGQAVSGVKSGRYPVKVAGEFKKIVASVINNADVRGLDKEHLLVMGLVVTQGQTRMKIQPLGRRRVRQSKATCLEILVKEMRLKKLTKKTAKKETKVEAKTEVKVKAETKVAEKKAVAKKEVKKPVNKTTAKKSDFDGYKS